jgi:dual specificity tyrosine-phosphorylation-regulated kinase 2/3/4
MNTKSLSPRIKSALKKNKIVLKKLNSLTKLTSPKPNESNNSLIPDSVINLAGSQLYSPSHISLKLSSPYTKSSLNLSTQNKIKTASRAASYIKNESSPKNVGENLLPLPSKKAVSIFGHLLSKYEISEILGFVEIYYLGLKARKIKPSISLKNMGFDDKETDYILTVGDHIAYQYEILELLGSGSFAQVCKCWDHKNKTDVAIKIIKSHRRFQQQGQVEVKILAYLVKNYKGSSGIFGRMNEYFLFRNHLCIVFELLSYSLYDLLKANNFKGLSGTLIQRFTVQILSGLLFLQENQIIHCDLKPENILLQSPQESLIKIIDFGLSCFSDEKIYYYIQSRLYRAPEIILGVPYSTAIDMWSLGCIIAELTTGMPLFHGENETDQLFAIMEVLGCPPLSLLETAEKKSKFFNNDGSAKSFINSKGKVRIPGTKRLEEKVMVYDAVYLDFLNSIKYLECFEWIPEKRITPDQALLHPWIQKIKQTRTRKLSKTLKSSRLKIN